MSNKFEDEVARYRAWRDELIGAIEAYQAWLDGAGHFDAQQALHFYDLIQSLKKDNLTIAFVAEFSRGKTELINALFFSDFKQRLLPSDAGRTTMCPTELFFDPNDEPYIRLLPIETRYREDSIANLKRMPVEWSRIKLDPSNTEAMIAAMQTLAEVKFVSRVEARTLGLWDDNDPNMANLRRGEDRVEIPAWRHALINYPHPLLKKGLVILDTPGLNALGAEPELTLNIIPAAHAALFLLATDTGVTKSDLEIWQKYIKHSVAHCLAVLNKIDVLWDELKTLEQIEVSIKRQLALTARQLALKPDQVIAISAQKALLARVRSDAELLARSGITRLEHILANDIIPTKQTIVRDSVRKAIGALVDSSFQSVQTQLDSASHELTELGSLTGKNREVIKRMMDKLQADKLIYDETVKNFNVTRGVIVQQGKILMSTLSLEKLDKMLEQSRDSIEGSWTTAGLSRGMQGIVRQTLHQFDKIGKYADQITKIIDNLYIRFHEKHGFEKLTPTLLNLDGHRQNLFLLAKNTEAFCKDPINLMTEKHFLIKKFYLGVVTQARQVYEQARGESETWLRGVLAPLILQIREHKIQIERRLDNVKKIHDNTDTLQARVAELEKMQQVLGEQRSALEAILLKLQTGPSQPEAVPDAKPLAYETD